MSGHSIVAKCRVCGVQWVVKAPGVDDQGCQFCGAPADAVTTTQEDEDD